MGDNVNEPLAIADFGWDSIAGLYDYSVRVGLLRDPKNPRKDRSVAWEENIEHPTEEDLMTWYGTDGPTWDIQIQEVNARQKDEIRVRYCGTILRNRKKFLEHWYNSRDFAWNDLTVKLATINEHPLEFKSSAFIQDMEGRRVWYNGQPGVIDHWLGSDDARLVIRPEDGTFFTCPPEFLKAELDSGNDPNDYYEEGVVVTTIFDPRVWWFREGKE